MNNTVQPFFASTASLPNTSPQKPKLFLSQQRDWVQFGSEESKSTIFIQGLLWVIAVGTLAVLSEFSQPNSVKVEAKECAEAAEQAGINLPETVQCKSVNGEGHLEIILPKKEK